MHISASVLYVISQRSHCPVGVLAAQWDDDPSVRRIDFFIILLFRNCDLDVHRGYIVIIVFCSCNRLTFLEILYTSWDLEEKNISNNFCPFSLFSTNGLGVWAVLSDMENTKAMGYQWTKSDSKKKLLSSLGLDERNIVSICSSVDKNCMMLEMSINLLRFCCVKLLP